jgi:hypothetical protein
MTSLLRRIAFTLAATFGLALPASAATTSIDFTDLWYIPSESGWGINLIQQGNVIFATLFVYGTDNTPRWYVASDLENTSGTSFSGTLFKTTGPYFGAPWTGNSPATAAGNMTITFNSPTTATLTYTADGANVTKNIVRQTWRNENLTGKYLGGVDANTSACSGGVPNQEVLISGTLNVAHNASTGAITLTLNTTTSTGATSVCTFNGTYTQAGKMGSVTGNWGCTSGSTQLNSGTFTLTDVQATVRGFNGGFQASDQLCQYSGNFGVVRQVNQ